MSIIVTGAAGFIGSNIVKGLNLRGERDIIAVDNLTQADKFLNLVDCDISEYLDQDEFLQRFTAGQFRDVRALFHQGACSDTTERDGRYMMDNNYRYSLALLDACEAQKVDFLYASSAATYGGGKRFVEEPGAETPLNVYGYSKLLLDQAVRRRLARSTIQITGFRYFNVYGPRETHKGRMASVAFHHFNQYREHGRVRLFGSWAGWHAGAQQRDFVSVEDVVAVNLHFLESRVSGIFNLGTGRAQTFNDVAVATVNALRVNAGEAVLPQAELVKRGIIEYIEFPDDLKGKYQNFTQADLTRLRAAGCNLPFLSVEDGVGRYVRWLLK